MIKKKKLVLKTFAAQNKTQSHDCAWQKVREEEKVSSSSVHNNKRSQAPFWVDWSQNPSGEIQFTSSHWWHTDLPLRHSAINASVQVIKSSSEWNLALYLFWQLPHLSHNSWMGWSGCSLSAADGRIRSLTPHKLNINLKESKRDTQWCMVPVNIYQEDWWTVRGQFCHHRHKDTGSWSSGLMVMHNFPTS